MKKLILLILIIIPLSITAQEIPYLQSNQIHPSSIVPVSDFTKSEPFTLTEPVWNGLRKLSFTERENSLIEIQLESDASNPALEMAAKIEQTWNSGRYEEALALFEQLKNMTDWREVSIGNSWKTPVTPSQPEMWGDDVRIGTRDSVFINTYDIHRASGNLLAALMFRTGNSYQWSVNFSSDGGETWSETYTWSASYELKSMDAAIAGDHFYVGFGRGPNQDQAFLYRFSTTDGSQQNFSTGSPYITVFTTISPVEIKEVSLGSNQEYQSNRVYYSAILTNGAVQFFWSAAPDFVNWLQITNNVGTANRGLDITFNENFNNYVVWISYVDNSNVLQIDGITAGGVWENKKFYSVGISGGYTSIGAYGDTITCVFDYTGTNLQCRYQVSYDGGTSWFYGILDDTTTAAESPSLTAKAGGGVGMAYRYYTTPREGRYIWRPYRGGWSAPESYADNQPYYNQPKIEYLGNDNFGVLYLSWNTPVVRGAYFDRSNWSIATLPPENPVALGGYDHSNVVYWDPPAGQSPLDKNSNIRSVAGIHSSETTEKPHINGANFHPMAGEPTEESLSFRKNRSTEQVLQSYEVYRSTTAGGPYTMVANVDRQYFRDLYIDNGVPYYYVIKAIYDVGSSEYSAEVSATPEAGGKIIESAQAFMEPTLDGNISAAEWADASQTIMPTVDGTQPVTLYTMNNQDFLYLAVDDPNNISLTDYDQFGIYFDEDNNFEWPPVLPSGEGNFWVQYITAGNRTDFREMAGKWPMAQSGTADSASGVFQGISTASGHVQYEIKIDLLNSEFNVPAGQPCGFYVFSYDPSGLMYGVWPDFLQTTWSMPAAYGTLVLHPARYIPAVMGVDPPSLAFNVEQGETDNASFTISNLGYAGAQDLMWLLMEHNITLQTSSGIKVPVRAYYQTTPPSSSNYVVRTVQKLSPNCSENVVSGSEKPTMKLMRGFLPVVESMENMLYYNGPLVNSPGTGAGGADESVVQSVTLGLNTLGFGFQKATGYRIADNFELTAEAHLDSLVIYAYQTSSTTTSTITEVNYRIWNGVPGDPASTVVYGDSLTNRLIYTEWSGIYRVTETSAGNTQRPIMKNVVAADVVLPAGAYWLDVQTNGSLASGPWAPPVTINGAETTGDAVQYVGGWSPMLDTGLSTPQGLPFELYGTGGGACNWMVENPLSGRIPTGGNQPVEVSVDATGLPLGTHGAELLIFSNDPGMPVMALPVEMTVVPPVGIEDPDNNLVNSFGLAQNYPNPFNPVTTIRYQLPHRTSVYTTLKIFNSNGQLVRSLVEAEQGNGQYLVTWDGRDTQGNEVASGVYFYTLKSGNFNQTKKLLKLK